MQLHALPYSLCAPLQLQCQLLRRLACHSISDYNKTYVSGPKPTGVRARHSWLHSVPAYRSAALARYQCR